MKTLHLAIIGGAGIAAVLVLIVSLAPAYTGRQSSSNAAVNSQHDIEKDCGTFQQVPGAERDLSTVPVLIMDSGSTACARLHFTVETDQQSTSPLDLLLAFRKQAEFRIGDYNVTSHDQSFTMLPGWDHTGLFRVFDASETMDNKPADSITNNNPVDFPAGTQFTITYIIHALPGSKGFYDYSLPRPSCGHYPLAVGYASSEVHAADFSRASPMGQLCESSPYKLLSIQVSGMTYKEVQMRTIPFQ